MEISLCFVPLAAAKSTTARWILFCQVAHVGDIIRIEGNEIPPLVVCRIRWELRQRVQGFVTQLPPQVSTGYVKRLVAECEYERVKDDA